MNASTCIRRAKKTDNKLLSFKPLKSGKFRASNGEVVKKAKTKIFRRHYEQTGRALKHNIPKIAFSFLEDGFVKARCPRCRLLLTTEHHYSLLKCASCGLSFLVKESKK